MPLGPSQCQTECVPRPRDGLSLGREVGAGPVLLVTVFPMVLA